MWSLKNIAICFIVAAISFACGWISTQYIFLELEYKLSILDVTSLVVTILLGTFIALRIPSQISEKRFEKDLIITEIKALMLLAQKIQLLVESNKISHTEIVAIFKESSQQIFHLENLFVRTNIEKKNGLEQIRREFQTLKSHTTSSGSSTRPYSLANKAFQVSKESVRKLHVGLVDLLIAVNRY